MPDTCTIKNASKTRIVRQRDDGTEEDLTSDVPVEKPAGRKQTKKEGTDSVDQT